jgi:hypothetical protein
VDSTVATHALLLRLASVEDPLVPFLCTLSVCKFAVAISLLSELDLLLHNFDLSLAFLDAFLDRRLISLLQDLGDRTLELWGSVRNCGYAYW